MSVSATPRPGMRWNIILLQLVFLYLVVLRLWFDLAVTPMGDEAYYWMWGQRPGWSYFDHPPLGGWLQGLVAALFGWSNFSVRLLTWLTLGGTLAILWRWSARLAPADRAGWFWHSAVIYLAIPVIFMTTTFALHDHLLVFFTVAAAYVFHGFAADWENGNRDGGRLYLAAALVGLAMLSKYNGVFLALGLAVWIVARPKLRGLLLTRQLWLAVLLAAVMQIPVIYWNVTEGFASLRFHLSDRPTANWGEPRLSQVIDYLVTMIALMSPVLFLSLFRLPWLKPHRSDEARALGLSASLYLTSTLGWAVIAAYVYVYFHWNAVAYAGLLPIAYRLLGSRVAWLHIAFGVVVVTVGTLTYTVTPTSLFGYRDLGAAASYGWPALADRIAAQHHAHPDAFLAATRYTYAAQLGFELRDPNVTAFNHTPSQYDYWPSTAQAGRDALIVADGDTNSGIAEAKGHFASVEKLEDVPVNDNRGQPVWSFEIWLGHGYSP